MMGEVAYWLVNSGTQKHPLRPGDGAVLAAFERWEARFGPVQGLDRPYSMRPGDVLIHRSIYTSVSRLVAVGTVDARPEARRVAEWDYSVRRTITDLVPTLRLGPPLENLRLPPIRLTKRLDDDTGAEAVRQIQQAANRAG